MTMTSSTVDRPCVFDARIETAIASGATVTNIRIWKHNPNLCEVCAGDLVIARLSGSDLKRIGEIEGTRVADLTDALRECIERDRGRRMAMSLLARRDFSVAALDDRLVKRGIEASHARAVTAELASEGWLDDTRLARTLVDSAIERGHATRQALAKVLADARIEASIAAQVLEDAISAVDEQSVARSLAKRRLAMNCGVSDAAQARRVANYLARRGFDEDTIREAMQACGVAID